MFVYLTQFKRLVVFAYFNSCSLVGAEAVKAFRKPRSRKKKKKQKSGLPEVKNQFLITYDREIGKQCYKKRLNIYGSI